MKTGYEKTGVHVTGDSTTEQARVKKRCTAESTPSNTDE